MLSTKFYNTIVVLRSYLYVQFLFPVTLQVISNFWVFYNIDRELIFPSELDKYVSSWDNHLLHTLIIIPLVVDLLHSSTPILLPNRQYCATVIFILGTTFQSALVSAMKNQNILKLLLLHFSFLLSRLSNEDYFTGRRSFITSREFGYITFMKCLLDLHVYCLQFFCN